MQRIISESELLMLLEMKHQLSFLMAFDVEDWDKFEDAMICFDELRPKIKEYIKKYELVEDISGD